jgi:hypothetical protein
MRKPPALLISRLSVPECKRRLEDGTEVDVPVASDMKLKYGILANVDYDGFQLRVRHALIRNSISPRLCARFQARPDATLIELRMRTSSFWIVWAVVSAAFMVYIAVVSLASVWRRPDAAPWLPAVVSLVFLTLLLLGFISARKDRHDLTRFVVQTLDATPVASHGGLTSRWSGPA